MHLTYDKGSQALIVRLAGDLDHHSASKARNQIDENIILKKPKKIIFDLSGLSFMDSSGIGIIMGRYRLMKERGAEVAICGIGANIRKLIDISGLKTIVKEYNTAEEAIMEAEKV